MRTRNFRATLYVCLFAGLSIGFIWLVGAERPSTAKTQPSPTLQGAAATHYLKEQGQYETLAAAVRAARLATPANLTERQKVSASDGAANDFFGDAVALSGDTAVVGAPFSKVNSNVSQGSAYVFVRSGTNWVEQQKLTAGDGAAGDLFGDSVALSGDTVVVGAFLHNVGAQQDQGAAYVFVRSGATWTQQQKLTASDGEASDLFGSAVAVNGDTVAVGAVNDDIGANLLQGSAYVFVRSGTTWTEQQRLTANDGAQADHFGNAVAINGNTAVVAAAEDIVGGNVDQGSVYVFLRNGVNWTQQQKLTASDGAAEDLFGFSLALSSDALLVGSLEDDIGGNANQGSAYVFVRNGASWTEQQKLTASDGAMNDRFGRSVALSADMAVVGSALDDNAANTNQGSAYIFARSGTNWAERQKLTASDGAARDEFGQSVALSGSTIIVGAYRTDSGANTDQGSAYFFAATATPLTLQQKLLANDATNDDSFGDAVALSGDTVIVGAPFDTAGIGPAVGSAYIFVRSGTTWTQQQKLTASDPGLDDHFGGTVAISGNTVIVGANNHDVGAVSSQGAAYVFVRSGTTWTQQQRLTASDGAANDFFGGAVALSGHTALIGAQGADSGAQSDQGAAYVFVRSGTIWTEQQKLTANDGEAGDFFGRAVALDGNTALVGVEFDDVSPNFLQGSVYVFVRSGTTWTLQQRLTAADGATGDGFGSAVAISGDTALAGAPFDDISGLINQGSAYVFVRSGTTWMQQQKLSAGDGAAHDQFGNAVALSGDRALVGAHFDDTGANTEQGSAYLFTRTGTAWAQAQKLTAFDGARDDAFGDAVTLDGMTAIVGAPLDDATFGNQGAVYVYVPDTSCTFALNPSSQNFAAGGGTGSVNVTAGTGCAWTATSNDAWLSITSGASGTGNGTIGYSVAANLGPARTGTLTIAGQTFTVLQASGCAFTINPSAQNFAAGGGAGNVSVTTGTGCNWTATSNAGFLTITAGASGSGAGTVSYSVAANSGPQRTGTLTIAGQTFTVTQDTGCNFSLNPTSQNFGAAGGTGSVNLTASDPNCAWTATSNDPWLGVTNASGTGSSAVGFTVQANTGPARTGTITIAGQTFTVTQAGGCSFAINPTSQNFAAAGGVDSVNVTTGAGCTWTATSNDSFITITAGSNGTGSGTVSYSVAANSGPARSGTMTIAGQTFTVNQASGCTFTINPNGQHFQAAGGASTVNVTTGAGCAWTATSNTTFITITAGATGNGNGIVSYNVAANPGLARNGTLTIAGQTFTVTQNAARSVKADFDGDGKTDLSVWRGADTLWLVFNSTNGALQTTSWGSSNPPFNDLTVPGDYDGDGKTDVAVWRPGNGTWFIKRSSDNSTQTTPWGAGYAPYNDVPVPGDYDGDGKTDLAVWRGSDSNWYIRRSSDGQVQISSWGSSAPAFNDVPVQADYDGDGRTDIAVFRRANGTWYIRNSSNNQSQIVPWGLGTDAPVPADYDGDGKADMAVWRGADTNWYVRRSSDGQFQFTSWGTSAAPFNDVPVPGDYDGDGKADIAVWRPLNGTWYVIRSTNGSNLIQPHGQNGDIPLPAR